VTLNSSEKIVCLVTFMVFVLRSLSVQIVKEVNIININVIVSIVSEKY